MPSRLSSTIHQFARAVVNPYDLDELLLRLATDAAAALDAGVGIMLENRDGGLDYAAASNETVIEAERYQDRHGEGACFHAFSTDQVVVIDDIVDDSRWPAYSKRMVELGLRAVIGTPLTATGQVIGVLNVYRAQPTSWTTEDVDACDILAAMGAAYILSTVQQRASNTLTEQLQHALDARVVIERAKGCIMSRERISAEDALQLLRTEARSNNRKLRDVAQETLDHMHH